MSIPNVSTLYQRISKGAEGGLEFARIINQLLISEYESLDVQFKYFSDASGDYRGVDAILNNSLMKTGLQYKFFPSPFSSNHKSSIKESFRNAVKKFPEMEEWILVTPEDPQQADMIWLDNLKGELNIQVSSWGHTKIINLMLKHPHIGSRYYPDLSLINVRPSNEPSQSDIHIYFNKFIDPDTDINVLFLKAQPTLSDCKAIFTKDFYKEVSDIYYLQYRHLFDDTFDEYALKSKRTFRIYSNTREDLIGKKHNLPGSMNLMLEKGNVLNSDTKFYRVSFLEEGQEFGVSFSVWCFINNRWVFFPKPYRVIESIRSMREDIGLRRIATIIKWLGLGKNLPQHRGQSILAVNHIVHEILTRNK